MYFVRQAFMIGLKASPFDLEGFDIKLGLACKKFLEFLIVRIIIGIYSPPVE